MKFLKRTLIFLLVVVIIGVLINFFVSRYIEKKILDVVLSNNSEYYLSTVEEVKFNLFNRSISLKEITLNPTDRAISELKESNSPKDAYQSISISSIKLKGIEFLKILSEHEINIDILEVNELLLRSIKNPEYKIEKIDSSSINLDSIYLKKIDGFRVNKIKLNNFEYQSENVEDGHVTFKVDPISLDVSGIMLEKYDEHLFKLKPLSKVFELNNIALNFNEKNYIFSIDKVAFNFEENLIDLKNIKYLPTKDVFEIEKTQTYNDAVFKIEVGQLSLVNFEIKKAISRDGIFIDSIEISEPNIYIYKNKRKPFPSKVKELPHVILKKLEVPVLVQKVNVSNGNLLLEEHLTIGQGLLKLTLDEINADVTNITSIKKYKVNPILVNLTSKVMNSAPLEAKIIFPLEDDNSSKFSFNGTLGASRLHYFDSAIYPILGLKILEGNLDHLVFNATANNYSSSGNMTMLYHNLKATVFKSKKSNQKSGFLSWAVNQAIHESNPDKKKGVRHVKLHYDRVPNHGFGSYLWKTLQSGITATLAPQAQKAADKLMAKKKKKDKKKKSKK